MAGALAFAATARAAAPALRLKLAAELGGARAAGRAPSAAPGPPPPLALRLDPGCPGCAAQARPGAEAIVLVTVNHVAKGSAFVWIGPRGRTYVQASDLRRFGITRLRTPITRIHGRPYVALDAAPGLSYRLDERNLELHIRVEPRALGNRQVFNLASRRPGGVLYPQPGGAFLNYNLTAGGDDAGGPTQLGAATELGLHLGKFLLLSDALVTHDRASGATRATRLSTRLVRDDRSTLQRLTLGDFVTAPSTSLDSSLRLGGVSLSKNYSIDPYAVTFPGQVISGTAALPSTVYLYSNGVLVAQESVQPGQYQLQNFVTLPGLQVTRVVVRDVLGNETTVVNPFYFSQALLRRGLDEYDLNVGLERRGFGLLSNDYAGLGLSGHYRVGLSDALTVGVSGEALGGRYHLGPSLTWRLGLYGVAGAALAYGRGGGTGGGAAALSYAYSGRHFDASVALRLEGRDFPSAAPSSLGNMRHQLAASFAYALGAGRSLGLTYLDTAPWDGARGRSGALTYRSALARGVFLDASLTRTFGAGGGSAVLFGLSYTPDAGDNPPSYDLQLQNGAGAHAQTVQVSGGNPDAAGLSYRATATRANGAAGPHTTFDPVAQFNFRAAEARAELYRDSAGGPTSYRLGVAGAVARIDGHWGLARPIQDSYGLVKVGHLAGIRVYANNIDVGRTGADGMFLIPRLASYFDNPIAIDPRDLPFDYSVPQARYIVSPSLRSGVLIDFKAHRVHGIAAHLVTRRDGKRIPFAGAEGEIDARGRKVASIYTGPGGRFYVEDIAAGDYTGRARNRAGTCEFTLRVPPGHAVVSDLGDLECGHVH